MTTTTEPKTDRAADCEVHCVHPEAVARVEAALPDDALIERATTLTKVVSDPTRLRILSALALEELCVCDLAWVVGASQGLVSHHLRLLRTNGLAASRRDGKLVMYRLTPAGRQLLTLVGDLEVQVEAGTR